MKKTFTSNHVLLWVPALLMFCYSCVRMDRKASTVQNPVKGNRYTDFRGAVEYEFNMLKNPVTGKIPDNVREQELAQAEEIYAAQMRTQKMTANTYTFQGPENLGGRTRSIAYDVRYNGGSNRVIIAGGVSGGIYKSTDDGATWTRKSPTSDLYSVTSIAQDPRSGSEDTWYYCTGEASGNSAGATGAAYRGQGVWKSTDNGESWSWLSASNTGSLESFDHRADYCWKIIVDPTSGDVYLAAVAGIYRSQDGGSSWSLVLSGTFASSTQATDIACTSTGILYAAFSGSNSAGTDGVWMSTTGDLSDWTRIAEPGTPAGWNANGAYGRVVLAVAPSDEDIVYALYDNEVVNSCSPGLVEAEMYYYDAGTTSWTDISSTLPNESGCLAGNDPFACQGGYDLIVSVKPDDAATVFIGGTNLYRSTNTGSTWTRIGGYASSASYALYASSHPDIHAVAFSPTSSTTMLCGNDGGIQRTTDNTAGTVAWTQINTGYRTYQYYYVTLDPRTANAKVLGGAQDNGSTRNTGGTGTSFEMVSGGDGVSVGLNDPAATGGTQFEYVGSQKGYIYRRPSTDGLGFYTDITPAGEAGTGLFVTLFKLDQDNSEFLYYANDDKIYRTLSASTVTSASWTDMTGISAAVTTSITALAVTRGGYSSSSNLFFGTSGGKVYRLDDPVSALATTVPVDISTGLPSAYVSSIAVNPRNDDTVMVTFSSYGETSVWWTGDANSATPTWTAVEGGLTLPSYRSSAIHAVPYSSEVHYFVGTSVGLYTSTGLPGSVSWTQESATDIGKAVVSSMALRPVDGKLLVGTHGYGMWYSMLSLFPLPVELTEFTGSVQQGRARLEWTTTAETNSSHFELERSLDGRNYTRIARLQAAGNSFSTRHYSFTDGERLAENNYYRLKSVDRDDHYKYSSVVLLKVPNAEQDIIVMGNPFSQLLAVKFVKPVQQGQLRLTDMLGRELIHYTLHSGQQVVQMQVPPGALSRSVYILEVNADGQKYTRKLTKE